MLAGPYCTWLLGALGAQITKVEMPGRGDFTRGVAPLVHDQSVYFMSVNRNKRSITLNLKDPAGRAALLRLVERSDIFVENNRPGVLESLGLGAEQLRAVNPKIVYASASGFGQTGPDRRRAGVNLIVEAFSGALSVTGMPGEMPMRPGVPGRGWRRSPGTARHRRRVRPPARRPPASAARRR